MARTVVVGIGVVTIGDEFRKHVRRLVMELDAQLVHHEAGDPHCVAVNGWRWCALGHDGILQFLKQHSIGTVARSARRLAIQDSTSELMSSENESEPETATDSRPMWIFAGDVLDQFASAIAWETIIDDWNGRISNEAIREAVQLASQALLRHADEFALKSVPA